MELYVDGVLEDTDVYTGGLGTSSGGSGNTEPIALGISTQISTAGSVTPTALHYDGQIDEVAMLNTQLAPEQVLNLYAAAQPDYSVSEDSTVNIAVGQGVLINDYDADGDPLAATNLDTTGTLGLVTLNANGSFDYDPNGQFETLGVGQTSTDTFTYTANDGGTNSAPATVTVTVAGVNDAPVITSNGGGPTAAFNISENTLAVTTVTATDVDVPADTLQYTKIGGADAGLFSLGIGTGVLVFNTAPDFEVFGDADMDNVYEVTVQVSDGNGGFDTQAISITVVDNVGTLTEIGRAHV
jgi:VCBS repeat-containing protein